MRYAPINPADLLVIAGEFSISLSLPAILGAEGVGKVVAIGEGVSGLACGDHAIPLTRGNWTSFRQLAAGSVLRVPPELPLAMAAMLRINPATAWRLLAQVQPALGSWLLQSGGDTAVARLLTILAKARGVNVINVVRPRHGDDPAGRRLAEGELLPERAAGLTGGAPIIAAFDCVAGEGSADLAACLAPGGRLILYGHLSGRPCVIPSGLLTGRGITVSGFSLRPAEAAENHARLQSLYDRLAATLLQNPSAQPVAAILPLTQLDDALALARGSSGEKPPGRVLLALDA
jgi:NADPH:quinone reductase-like Zn-dependent oxidoreductase